MEKVMRLRQRRVAEREVRGVVILGVTGSMDLSPPPFSPPFLEGREDLIQSPLVCSIGFKVVRIFSNARVLLFGSPHLLDAFLV